MRHFCAKSTHTHARYVFTRKRTSKVVLLLNSRIFIDEIYIDLDVVGMLYKYDYQNSG